MRLLTTYALGGLLLLALATLAGPSAPARAEGPLLFSIQPAAASVNRSERGAYFSFTLPPDSGADEVVVVSNTGNEPITVKLYPSDGITSINGSTAFAAADEVRSNVRTWLTASTSQLEVPPGQAVSVPFHVHVPSDAGPGDHVAGWVVEAPPKSGAAGGLAASVVERAGVAVVVRVPGPTEQNLVLGGICLNQETGSNYFEVAVRNDGNILTSGDGSLTLETKDGDEVFNRPAELGNVVPNDGTALRLDAPLDPGPGRYVAVARLTQPDGREIESRSDISIGEKKVNGCVQAAGASDEPQQGIPVLRELPGGATPWLLIVLLAGLFAGLIALREYTVRRRLRAERADGDDRE